MNPDDIQWFTSHLGLGVCAGMTATEAMQQIIAAHRIPPEGRAAMAAAAKKLDERIMGLPSAAEAAEMGRRARQALEQRPGADHEARIAELKKERDAYLAKAKEHQDKADEHESNCDSYSEGEEREKAFEAGRKAAVVERMIDQLEVGIPPNGLTPEQAQMLADIMNAVVADPGSYVEFRADISTPERERRMNDLLGLLIEKAKLNGLQARGAGIDGTTGEALVRIGLPQAFKPTPPAPAPTPARGSAQQLLRALAKGLRERVAAEPGAKVEGSPEDLVAAELASHGAKFRTIDDAEDPPSVECDIKEFLSTSCSRCGSGDTSEVEIPGKRKAWRCRKCRLFFKPTATRTATKSGC